MTTLDTSKPAESRDSQANDFQPTFLQRACVFAAESFGWLDGLDRTILSDFRERYPLTGTAKQMNAEDRK